VQVDALDMQFLKSFSPEPTATAFGGFTEKKQLDDYQHNPPSPLAPG
jgi:hypothetical protein